MEADEKALQAEIENALGGVDDVLQRAFQKLDLKQEESKKIPFKVDLGANNDEES